MPLTPASKSQVCRDVVSYVVAVTLGSVAGLVNLKVDDLLLTALLVLAFTMGLGVASPERPWRWALLVSACVPVALLVARFFAQHFSRGQVYGSFLGFLPGIVGAYGGAFMRSLMGNLFQDR